MNLIFCPGAGGAAEFWQPLGALLPVEWKKTYLFWPGLGNQPHEPAAHGFDDLVAFAEKAIAGPTVLIAQSMGGIVAVRLALKRPDEIAGLVLVVTSGGVDVSALGGADWRAAYLANFPDSKTWITEERPDHTAEIPDLGCPTLLIYGDNDPISPVTVGKRLSDLIPQSELCVIAGGTHDLGKERAHDIAPLVIGHVHRCFWERSSRDV
jgi:pimeloyl-ACP methyl ester carboxylesterase